MENFKLQNGVLIPSIGFGTWQMFDETVAVKAVTDAIGAGYRHIDTATIYRNEKAVGEGIRKSGIDRKEIFVTSKVWNTERGYDKTLKAFEKTMDELDIGYLDLYLIHWPADPHQYPDWKDLNFETWCALEEIYAKGVVNAIGVSNFLPVHLEPLMYSAKVMPMVNQIEYHPGYMQNECVSFCHKNNIVTEGWSPLGMGKLLDNEILKGIADKYGKSTAQICIRWSLQNKVIPLPKSVHPGRIKDNLDVFDFEISSEDMKKIDNMAETGWSGLAPGSIDF